MPRFAANLSMLFTEQDFLARFKLQPTPVSAVSNTSSRMISAPPKSNSSSMPMA